jgi:hypothetical protein
MPRKGASGFVLLTLAFALVLLIGVTGLVVDLGRLYIARTELQAAADAAALAAAYELDGSARGLERAIAQVAANLNRWNFGTETPALTVGFSSSPEGPFQKDLLAEQMRYLEVRARGVVSTYFVPAASAHHPVEAAARAGQTRADPLPDAWFPYAADAVNPKSPDFGWRSGRKYPLRLIDVGGGAIGPHYQVAVFQAILNGTEGRPLSTGDPLSFADPDWESESAAWEQRLAQDTDPAAPRYADYAGNGRRLVIVPVNDPASDTVLGFAGFFLSPEPSSFAEYVGAALLPGRKGAGPAGVYRVSLIQ